MKLVHPFPHALPVDWPEDSQQNIYLVEDGNDQELEIIYQDTQFRRPMAPWTSEQVRAYYPSQEAYLRRKAGQP